jgi:DNA-binding MarR family transcriptional regulator
MSDDPYAQLERELTVLLRTITRAKRHDADNPLHGVEPTALWLLSQLVECGPHRLTALAAAVQLDVSTVSRQVATLEGRGWVERHPDPDDGRAVLFHPTPVGLALLESNHRRRMEFLRELVSDWSPADRDQLARLLSQLNQEMRRRLVPEMATEALAGHATSREK